MKTKTFPPHCWLLIAFLFTANSVFSAAPLLTAIKNKNIEVVIKGNGSKNGNSHYGKCLNFQIRNLSSKSQTIQMNAGLKLASDDPGKQDMIITENQIFAMAANQTKNFDVCGMCIEKNDAGPSAGLRFKTNGYAQYPLLDMSEFIAQKGFQTSAGQAAVWVITDKASPENIVSESKKEMNELRDFVYSISSTPDFNEYCISGEFVCNKFCGEKVNVIAYDANNKQISVIANNMTLGDNQNYYAFKLTSPYIRRNRVYSVRMIRANGEYLELTANSMPN
ncbi:MAG: hypothetical protein V2A54_11760 [Bacteroidota bacterium]